jgi:hypothetical protein
MTEVLQEKVKAWLKEFEETQPKNLIIDGESFEGSAYYLLTEILELSQAVEDMHSVEDLL